MTENRLSRETVQGEDDCHTWSHLAVVYPT
jgi:hypothetical protein